MSASTRRSVSVIAGSRSSHGPYRPQRFQVAMRTLVSSSVPYPAS